MTNAIAEPLKRHLRDTTLTIRSWTPDAERALHLLSKYLEHLHLRDDSTRVVTWAVLTLADIVKAARANGGNVAIPGAAAKPKGKTPSAKDLRSRDRIMVVGWSEQADKALEYLRAWAADDLKIPMLGNKVATWAVLTLADLIAAYWSGKEVTLPTADTARWEGFRQL